MIQTYESGGRGKKQCPSCSKYVGAVSLVCACGHVFRAKAKPDEEEKVIKTYDEPGRGRKKCGGCGKYVGVRNHACVCGYQFGGDNSDIIPVAEPVAVAPEPVRVVVPPKNHCRLVSTPAGACPVKLAGSTPVEVGEWAQSVIAKGRTRGEDFQFTALRYWVREFYGIGTPEYEDVVAILQGIMLSAA